MKKDFKTILIIEDDFTLSKNLKELIELKEYRAIVCNSIIDASELLQTIIPDLIISDIMMPDFDGYTLLNKVKKNVILQHVPFIFISGKADIKDIRFGMNLGADDYITKPFSAKDLFEAIEIRIAKNENLIKQLRSQNLLINSKEINDEINFELIKSLSKTEKNIIRLIAENKTSDEIAQLLNVSKKTIENHRYNLAKKLNINGKLSLLRFCLNNSEKVIAHIKPIDSH
jgi:two-component system OmpR family response regulator